MSEATTRRDPWEELRAIPDAHERLMWLTERGRRVPSLAVHERIPVHRVPGCVSAVWLMDESRDGRCRFRGDAEAPVLRGLVALICDRANGRTVTDVAIDSTDVVAALGLERHLTPTRTAGLRALQAQVRNRAAAHAAGPSP